MPILIPSLNPKDLDPASLASHSGIFRNLDCPILRALILVGVKSYVLHEVIDGLVALEALLEGSAGDCPPPVAMGLGAGGSNVPLESPCDYLEIVRYHLLAVGGTALYPGPKRGLRALHKLDSGAGPPGAFTWLKEEWIKHDCEGSLLLGREFSSASIPHGDPNPRDPDAVPDPPGPRPVAVDFPGIGRKA